MNIFSLLARVATGQTTITEVITDLTDAGVAAHKLIADLRAEVEALKSGKPLPADISALHDAAQLTEKAAEVISDVTGLASAAGLPQATVLEQVAAGVGAFGKALSDELK